MTPRTQSRPLPATVREDLRALIDSGQLRAGRKLPPEPQPATELGVSRATLREALSSLEEEGGSCSGPAAPGRS